MHVCLPISNLTVVRNRDRMWLFMPTDELKKDSLRHGRDGQPQVQEMVQSLEDLCVRNYKGRKDLLLRDLGRKEWKVKLQGSTKMRSSIRPTARYDVPASDLAKSPDIYCGYSTHRSRTKERLDYVFSQPRPRSEMQHRRTKGNGSVPPMCLPGKSGRTNCSGWAAANSTEGYGARPQYLRGSVFAQAHEQF